MDTLIPTERAPVRTRLQLRTANAISRRFVEDAVEGRREDATRFLAAMEHAISLGITAGADMEDIATGTRDIMSNLIGGMEKDLDEAGAETEDAAISLSDLDALIAQLKHGRGGL